MDTISDFITRIKNSLMAGHKTVAIPYSRLKENIAKILLSEGFISNFQLSEEWPPSIIIHLKYSSKGESVIRDIKRISKQSRRIYMKSSELKSVRNGLGIAIVTTSKGLMTDRDARKNNIGGEVICEVW